MALSPFLRCGNRGTEGLGAQPASSVTEKNKSPALLSHALSLDCVPSLDQESLNPLKEGLGHYPLPIRKVHVNLES